MSRVLVVDTERHPLHPCTPARARLLLKQHKAAVLRRFPFTIVLQTTYPKVVPLRLKIDPGSKTTGLALVNETSGGVVWAAELTHRGEQVRDALKKRRTVRRARRNRKTRYRPARFHNRRKRQGWLPPSLESRLTNIITWVKRLQAWCPIQSLSLELVKFDLALLQQPDLSGVDYRYGTLFGMEVRAYLLNKWDYRCAYCQARNVRLELDHVVPKSRGGSDRVSNLVVACHACNQVKGDRPIQEFLADQPDLLHCILAQVKTPLHDAAAVNTTRWTLYERLQATGLPVEIGTGCRTAWNRLQRDLPKKHWIDACCVGASTPEQLFLEKVRPLLITAMGRQCRQMCLMDKHGFPRSKAKRRSTKHTFRTGDIVRALVPSHRKHPGAHVGRIAAKANGTFTITTATGLVTDIGYRYCTRLHRADGYAYHQGPLALLKENSLP